MHFFLLFTSTVQLPPPEAAEVCPLHLSSKHYHCLIYFDYIHLSNLNTFTEKEKGHGKGLEKGDHQRGFMENIVCVKE